MLAGVRQLARPVLHCHRSTLTPRMVSQNAVSLKSFNENLSNLGTNIFSVMTALSLQHKSINLGQVGLHLTLSDQLQSDMSGQLYQFLRSRIASIRDSLMRRVPKK